MQRPPPIASAVRFPATAGFFLLALAASVPKFMGADIDPLVMDLRAWHGEPWRLVSCVFPHGDVLHIVFNLYWLWTLGSIIEQRLGSFATLGIYLSIAAGSSAIDWVLASGGIGLSGIGYGNWALLAVLSRRDPRFAATMDADTNRLFGFWFVLCIVLTQMGMMNVANAAHGAGAVLGALAALAISEKGVRRAAAAAAFAALIAVPIVLGPRLRPTLNLTEDGGRDAVYLGTLALEQQRNDEAIAFLEHGVAVRPRDAGAWWNLGIAYTRAGRHTEADAAFQRAQAIDPNVALRTR